MKDKEITEKIAEWMEFEVFTECGHLHELPNKCYRKVGGGRYYLYHNWNPLENISDAWEVEEKIKNKELSNEYVSALFNYFDNADIDYKRVGAFFSLIHATPRERCMAMIKVIDANN